MKMMFIIISYLNQGDETIYKNINGTKYFKIYDFIHPRGVINTKNKKVKL